MSGRNIANVSWGDHVEWGEGSAGLRSPDDFARSVERWVERDGAQRIHFREQEYYRRFGKVVHKTWRSDQFDHGPGFDENAEVLRRGHEAGLAVWLYVTIFDELWLDTDWYWPWDPGTNWLSDYVRDNPDEVLVDRDGRERLWGVLDYNSAAARAYRVEAIRTLLGEHEWDGAVRVHTLAVAARRARRPVRVQRALDRAVPGAVRRRPAARPIRRRCLAARPRRGPDSPARRSPRADAGARDRTVGRDPAGRRHGPADRQPVARLARLGE